MQGSIGKLMLFTLIVLNFIGSTVLAQNNSSRRSAPDCGYIEGEAPIYPYRNGWHIAITPSPGPHCVVAGKNPTSPYDTSLLAQSLRRCARAAASLRARCYHTGHEIIGKPGLDPRNYSYTSVCYACN